MTDDQVIAEFMDCIIHTKWEEYLTATYYASHHPFPRSVYPITEEQKKENTEIERKNIWNVKYKTSWDALVPVVKKIYSLPTPVFLSDDTTFSTMKWDLKSYVGFLDIGSSYAQVVKIIKWYKTKQ